MADRNTFRARIRVPSEQISGFARERYAPEVYAEAQRLVTGDGSGARPTARQIADELEAHFGVQAVPAERTVAEWIRTGRLRPVSSDEVWSVARSTPGEAQFVLPVIQAFRERSVAASKALGRRVEPSVVITVDEARVIALVGAAAPRLPPLIHLDLARMYLAMDRIGASSVWLDQALAAMLIYTPWESPAALERLAEAVDDGRVAPVMPLGPGFEEIYIAMQARPGRQGAMKP